MENIVKDVIPNILKIFSIKVVQKLTHIRKKRGKKSEIKKVEIKKVEKKVKNNYIITNLYAFDNRLYKNYFFHKILLNFHYNLI